MSVILTDLQKRIDVRLKAVQSQAPVSEWISSKTSIKVKEVDVSEIANSFKIILHGVTKENRLFGWIEKHSTLSSLSVELPLLAIDLPIDQTAPSGRSEDEYDTRELVTEYERRLFEGQLEPLALAIERNSSLTHLDLSAIDLSLLNDMMFNRLFEAICNQARILKIDTGNNKLTAERATIIEDSTQPTRTDAAADYLDTVLTHAVSNLILVYFDIRPRFTRKGDDSVLTKDYAVRKLKPSLRTRESIVDLKKKGPTLPLRQLHHRRSSPLSPFESSILGTNDQEDLAETGGDRSPSSLSLSVSLSRPSTSRPSFASVSCHTVFRDLSEEATHRESSTRTLSFSKPPLAIDTSDSDTTPSILSAMPTTFMRYSPSAVSKSELDDEEGGIPARTEPEVQKAPPVQSVQNLAKPPIHPLLLSAQAQSLGSAQNPEPPVRTPVYSPPSPSSINSAVEKGPPFPHCSRSTSIG